MNIEVAIIGGGPAGMTAGVFTCRAGLNTILFESLAVGGQMALSHEIKNFPSVNSISGFDLANDMREHAEALGLKIIYSKVSILEREKNKFKITANGETYIANKVIIATGCKARKLGIEKEKELTGRGVSYCASCDGAFFKGKDVAVVGGGDTAMVDVEYLTRIARHIYLINRSEKYKAHKVRVDAVKKLKNVEIINSAQVVKLHGEEKLDGITIQKDGINKRLDVDGLFVAIGRVPDLSFINFDLKLDENGYIVVKKDMSTSVKNLYACGDIISKHFRQVITACADGAIAGNSCVGVK